MPAAMSQKGDFMAEQNHTPDDALVQIPLTRGYITTVSNCDSDLIEFKWYVIIKRGRFSGVYRQIYSPKISTVYIHRVIMERILNRPLSKGEVVDHVNGDVLDNTRINLRLATQKENSRNRSKSVNKTGYKAVYPVETKKGVKFVAKIEVDGRSIQIGTFLNQHDAARAYNDAAKIYHGEFARLNIIEDEHD